MDIYKTKTFQRALKKSGLTDTDLYTSCAEMAAGLIDADYGGHLYKKRVARPGQGKSGSYRTLIGARLGEQYFFLYLFEKGAKDNIDAKEEKALKQLAKLYLGQPPEWVRQQVEKGLLIQVDNK